MTARAHQATPVPVAYGELVAFAARVLHAAGIQPIEATTIATQLVEANLRGVDGHGVLRLHQYVQSIRAGHINVTPNVTVNRFGAAALVDADGGYGFSPSTLATEIARSTAHELGAGVAGVKNSHHFGMASTYALQLADAGLVGISISNTMAVLPAPGGLVPLVGNDPIAIAVPRAGRDAVVVDLALSEASWGKISLAASRDEEIPSNWAFDKEGRPTSSPHEALAAKLLAPVGGYKGFALAALLELVAGGLTGSPVGPNADGHSHRTGGCGHLFIALDPAAFGGTDTFRLRVEELARAIEQSRTSGAPARLPGSRSALTRRERIEGGIPLTHEVRAGLNQLAQELGAPEL